VARVVRSPVPMSSSSAKRIRASVDVVCIEPA
jgi:hypothetical protein